jgi:hypothetical protein
MRLSKSESMIYINLRLDTGGTLTSTCGSPTSQSSQISAPRLERTAAEHTLSVQSYICIAKLAACPACRCEAEPWPWCRCFASQPSGSRFEDRGQIRGLPSVHNRCIINDALLKRCFFLESCRLVFVSEPPAPYRRLKPKGKGGG